MSEFASRGTAQYLSCGRVFRRAKRGHVFCSPFCRHRGAWQPEQARLPEPGVVDALFDPRRAPGEQVRPDDWHPCGEAWAELDASDSVAQRRGWYRR